MHVRSGYILVFALLVLTLIIALATQIYNQGMVQVSYAQTVLNREKAKTLALSGLSIAMSQLVAKAPEMAGQPADAKNKPDEKQLLLKKILPTLNRWQIYQLHEEIDGIDGVLGLSISCEQGKLDINSIYDFAQKKFVGQDRPQGDMKKLVEWLFKRMKDWTDNKDLFPVFEQFLKERGDKLNDITELLSSKQFAVFKDAIFYEPPITAAHRAIYLTDIFTVDSGQQKMEPWLFSDAWCAILNFSRATVDDTKKRIENMTAWLKAFKPNATWKTDWNVILKPVYEKDFTTLPKDIESILASQFEPHTFSVLSYGKVGGITQQLYAILEKQLPVAKGKEENKAVPFVIKKLYWI